ncbi:MAG: MotA/TolQ/ExbB proton channel family protein [Bdellovibrionales bacterium]
MFSKAVFISVLFFVGTAFSAETNSYQEEYVFLKNQLEALKSRQKRSVGNLKKLENNLNVEIQSLGLDVAKAESQNEILKSQISTFDENRTDEERNVKRVFIVEEQMKEFALKKNKEIETVGDLNRFMLAYLEKGAGEFSYKGEAYNSKGVKEEGEIYALGHVASYFVKENGEYIPLATNASKTGLVFTDARVSKAEMMNASNEIRSIQVSLKEGELVKEKKLGVVLNEKLDAGGAVGYVILFLGLLGLGIAFIRYNLIRVYTDFKEEDIGEIVSHIQNGKIDAAKKALYEQKTSPLNQFVDLLLSCRHKTDEVYEAIVVGEISRIQSRVSKYGPYLLVLAAVAPLLGLLGTVTGMIGTFDMITVHGTGNPKILSGGIKEALVTTQMGLIVAIPCILVGNYLSSKAFKVVNKFEELASIIPKG